MTHFSAALQGSVQLGLHQGLAMGSNRINFAIWAFMSWYGSRLVMHHGVTAAPFFPSELPSSSADCKGNIFSKLHTFTIYYLLFIQLIPCKIRCSCRGFGSGLENVKYLLEAIVVGARIMEEINRVQEIDSSNMEGQMLQGVAEEVEFQGVEFAYPSDNMVFKGFSRQVEAGQTVALVGG